MTDKETIVLETSHNSNYWESRFIQWL